MPCREQREEVISVTEKDLRRCGNNLRLLRECHEKMRLQREKEPNCENSALSFRSAFAQLCRSNVDAHDPWKDLENPEVTRELREADFILNQVWTEALPRHKNTGFDPRTKDELLPASARGCSSSVSTRASSADAAPSPGQKHTRLVHLASGEGRRKASRRCRNSSVPPRRDLAAARRSSSVNRSLTPSCESKSQLSSHDLGQPTSFAGQAACCKEDSAVASGSVVDRIRLRSPSPATAHDFEEACTGSLQVREATRMQQGFTQKLDENRLVSSMPGVAWLFVNPLTGEVSSYPKAVVTRVEAAHRLGRTNVPLVGTGGDFEGAIIQFSDGSDRGSPIQKTWDGDICDVRRIEVRRGDAEIVVHVVHFGGAYHLSDVAVPGKSEERRLPLSRIELARPQSSTLPPVNPYREPVYFLNMGAWPS